jgi:hypothetical protein
MERKNGITATATLARGGPARGAQGLIPYTAFSAETLAMWRGPCCDWVQSGTLEPSRTIAPKAMRVVIWKLVRLRGRDDKTGGKSDQV